MDSAQSLARQGFFDVYTAGNQLTAQLLQCLKVGARVRHLSEIECRALWICHRNAVSGANQTELARDLGLSATYTSELLDSLRNRGLIRGERRPPDRRRQFWLLTKDGIRQIVPLAEELDDLLLATDEGQSAAGQFCRLVDDLAALLKSPPQIGSERAA